MAGQMEIVWNGNHGRTISGREFRRSDDGSIYERVGEEYKPITEKVDNHVNLDTIQWEGENGRTVNGRKFRKSGESIYERVKDEWVPFYKPQSSVVEKEEVMVEEEPEAKATAKKQPQRTTPKQKDLVVPPRIEVMNDRVQNTVNFLDRIAQKSNRLAASEQPEEGKMLKTVTYKKI